MKNSVIKLDLLFSQNKIITKIINERGERL